MHRTLVEDVVLVQVDTRLQQMQDRVFPFPRVTRTSFPHAQ
jgi:hypothetical protein